VLHSRERIGGGPGCRVEERHSFIGIVEKLAKPLLKQLGAKANLATNDLNRCVINTVVFSELQIVLEFGIDLFAL